MITNTEQLLDIYDVKTEEELSWLDWEDISIQQTLSEEFIEKHSDKINWYLISKHQTLSEEFIDKHSDKVDWYCISKYQTLSESFIGKHADKELNWRYVILRQSFSKEFFRKHWETIPVLSVVRNCGKENRNIYRLKKTPEIIKIGCFSGTKEEAIEAIKKKYKSNPVAMQQYIDKVEECFNTTLID